MRITREEAIERCYTCQYRGGGASCHYCLHTGKLRGCDIEECPYYVNGRKLDDGDAVFNRNITTSGYHRLSQEMILLAIEDYNVYLNATNSGKKPKDNAYRSNFEKTGKEAEIFFNSDEFTLYSDLDGKKLAEKIRKEYTHGRR